MVCLPFNNFIKHIDTVLHSQYCLEKFKEGHTSISGVGNFVVDEALAGQNAVRVSNVETKQSKIISLGGPFDGVFTRGNTNEKIKEIDSFLQGGVATNEDVQGGTITQVNGQNVFKR